MLYILSPHLQFLLARDSNSQPLDYESDSLTIRPRLPSCSLHLWDFAILVDDMNDLKLNQVHSAVQTIQKHLHRDATVLLWLPLKESGGQK